MGLSDTPMRDRRKISLFDVSEVDPYRGRAIYTGMGVGEDYIGAGWEDRAIMAEGSVLLELRSSARQILLNQGFREYEIPWELHPKPYGEDYHQKIQDFLDTKGDWGWTMEIHNQNTRSLALGGEVALVTGSWRSLSGLMDFITIAGLCEWIDSIEDLEELFPRYDGMARRISRFIRLSV